MHTIVNLTRHNSDICYQLIARVSRYSHRMHEYTEFWEHMYIFPYIVSFSRKLVELNVLTTKAIVDRCLHMSRTQLSEIRRYYRDRSLSEWRSFHWSRCICVHPFPFLQCARRINSHSNWAVDVNLSRDSMKSCELCADNIDTSANSRLRFFANRQSIHLQRTVCILLSLFFFHIPHIV